MPRTNQILALEVPIVVRLGERRMPVRDVISLVPGMIIELTKSADEELDLLVNNRQIGHGNAVKLGENFGIQITNIGDQRERVAAMSGVQPTTGPTDDDEAADLAAQFLAGQL